MTSAGVLTVALSILLATALLMQRPGKARGDRYLAGFLLLSALDMAGWTAPLLPEALRPFLVFRMPAAFLQMPCLLAYAVMMSDPDARARRRLRAGIVLTVLSALSLAPRAFGMAGFGILEQLVARKDDLLVNSVGLHLQFYIYAALIGARLFSRDRPIADRRVRRWLRAMLAVSLAAHALVLAKTVAAATGNAPLYAALDVVVAVNAALVLATVLLLALAHRGAPPLGAVARTPRPILPADEAQMARLHQLMGQAELYLDPQLSLKTLARRAGLPQREVSRLLNDREGSHFFDFVNRYRTHRAARLLTDPAWAERTILDIAHEVGFNSKSSFNAAFLKHQGAPPSRVRRMRRFDDAELRTTDFA